MPRRCLPNSLILAVTPNCTDNNPVPPFLPSVWAGGRAAHGGVLAAALYALYELYDVVDRVSPEHPLADRHQPAFKPTVSR